MSSEYPVEDSEKVYDGRVITLRRDTVRMSDGTSAVREVIQHLGAVGVLALDDADRVVIVNQYRHPVRARLDELPAGLLDVAGESALSAAQRELAEEAGLVAERWDTLVDLYLSPGVSDEAIRIFLARDLRPSADSFTAEHEELTMTVERVPLVEALRRVAAGELTNAAAAAGILAAAAGLASDWSGLRPADAPWPARPGR